MNRRQIEHFYLLVLALDTAVDAAHAARELLSKGSAAAGAAARLKRKAAAYSVLIKRLEAVVGLSGEEDSELRMLDAYIVNGDVESAEWMRRRIVEDRVREFAHGGRLDEMIHGLSNQIVELYLVLSTLREVRGE